MIRKLFIFLLLLLLPMGVAFGDDFVPSDEEQNFSLKYTLDSDDKAGAGEQIILQFGSTLAKFLAFDIDSDSFQINDNLSIGAGVAADVTLNFNTGTDQLFGWDDSQSSFSTFGETLEFRTLQSSSPPFLCTGSVTGTQWMDTDTGILYICDTSNSRDSWLSMESFTLFGDESSSCGSGSSPSNGNCNVDWGNGLGPDNSTDLGLYLPYPATITAYGFSADNDACSSGSFDVEVWSTGSNTDDNSYSLEVEVDTGLTGQAHNSNTLNIQLNGNQYILWGLDNNCGQSIDDFNIILYYRWRHA